MPADRPLAGDEVPLDLAALAVTDSPDVVRTALRRFRRRVALRTAIVVAVVAAVGLLLALRPSTTFLPDRFREARPTDVMAVVGTDAVDVVVLQAARLDVDTYGLRLLAIGKDLPPSEGVFVLPPRRPPLAAPSPTPPPGPPLFEISTSGFSSAPAQEAWVAVPAGTSELTVEVGAGVPARGGNDDGPAAPTTVNRPQPALRIGGPPTEPGTERLLGEVVLDLEALGVPHEIWRSEP
jgi:hypothetical protein